MAKDKVVDSAVLDAGLKKIADAIREKGGTSDVLAFPDAMAEAIAEIGAGGGDIYSEILSGSFLPAEDTNVFSIPGYSGGTVDFLVFYTTTYISSSDVSHYNSPYVVVVANAYNGYKSCYFGIRNNAATYTCTVDGGTLTFGGGNAVLCAGNKYYWAAGVIK